MIANLPSFVETERVDIEGANSDVIRRVGLTLPPGVSAVDQGTVLVEVTIEAVETSYSVVCRQIETDVVDAARNLLVGDYST